MATPSFITDIRVHIGHTPLWLPGVSAVVQNAAGEILLGRRADTGRWSLISGIPEPGEEPAAAIVREVFEETGVRVEPERITSVTVGPVVTYPNGDVCQYLNVTFACRPLTASATVNDDESLEVGWFPVDDHPPLDEVATLRLERALAGDTAAWFASPGETTS
ncbi:NUDIX hydrolase [Asanoa ishikariensis]|uniref:ADP-ribose pyrophosphatase YjhB, NUDIX family n=1 Tax=Asanoa ishikariensis TaxID=137265 RepID=A0A1H3UX01_9ACTN|nr:NUDIX domain-containing protein [Asanoa ishikariensis]GIF65277.1 NUDIX hydrolase [Asanoa ishikariensis]SDZ66816.1 ADP-ribose pyrophosphatase YjhB, NUDIX family [Asanoa ishikariensis]